MPLHANCNFIFIFFVINHKNVADDELVVAPNKKKKNRRKIVNFHLRTSIIKKKKKIYKYSERFFFAFLVDGRSKDI